MANCKVMCIVNQNGRVGKTTTTLNLGVALARLGKKILLVDADPQADLTIHMGYYDSDNMPNIATLMKATMAKQKVDIDNVILHSKENIDLIPSSVELADLTLLLGKVDYREEVMKDSLALLKDRYDYILVDCMPSLDIIIINALAFASEAIIPVQAQYLSVKATGSLIKTVKNINDDINPNLKIRGLLLTMVDNRTTFSSKIIDILKSGYGKYVNVFNTQIPMAINVARSSIYGASIFDFNESNRVADAYLQFAKEIELNGKERKQYISSQCR